MTTADLIIIMDSIPLSDWADIEPESAVDTFRKISSKEHTKGAKPMVRWYKMHCGSCESEFMYKGMNLLDAECPNNPEHRISRV